MVLKNCFQRYSFIANTVTFTTLFGLGDFVEQQRERYYDKLTDKTSHLKPYNFRRTLNITVVGALMSPIVHYWYLGLDRFIVGNIHSVVVRKVLGDEIIMSPAFASTFLGGMAKMEGKSNLNCWKEIKLKFWPMYKMDLMIWPAAQTVNFYLVPSPYRVAYISFVALIWNIYLSHISYKGEREFCKNM